MRILSVYDLSATEAIKALRQLRAFYLSLRNNTSVDQVQIEDDNVLRRVYETIGGRTSYITRVARAGDMISELPSTVPQLMPQRRRMSLLRWRRAGFCQSAS